MVAAERGYTEIVELLIRHGADREQKDVDGRTALMLAIRKGRIAVMNVLLHAHTEHFSHYSDVPRALVGDQGTETTTTERK